MALGSHIGACFSEWLCLQSYITWALATHCCQNNQSVLVLQEKNIEDKHLGPVLLPSRTSGAVGPLSFPESPGYLAATGGQQTFASDGWAQEALRRQWGFGRALSLSPMWMDRKGEGSPQERDVRSLVMEGKQMMHMRLRVVVESEKKAGVQIETVAV